MTANTNMSTGRPPICIIALARLLRQARHSLELHHQSAMGRLSLTTTVAGSIIHIAEVGTVVVPFTALFLALGDNQIAL
jgi:hypothetical protein